MKLSEVLPYVFRRDIGGWRRLVARNVWDVEVVGSNPTPPTNHLFGGSKESTLVNGNTSGQSAVNNVLGTLPPIVVCGKAIAIRRMGLVRVATLRDEICDEGVDDPEAMIAELKRLGLADILNFRQQLPHTDRLFSYYCECDNLAVLEITTYDHWWNKQIGNDARRMVRKAEKKGITVRVLDFNDELIAGIKSIWDEAPLRQGRPNRHYKKDFDTVKRESSTFPDRAEFIGAFFGDELVGFDKIFYTGERADHINIMSKIAHRDKAPTNALIAKAVALSAERKVRFMTYAKFSYGKKGDDSLTDFKERNGFKRVDIPRYFVPLNSKGALAIKLGLHKGFKEALPAFVLRSISQVRTKWSKITVHLMTQRLNNVSK